MLHYIRTHISSSLALAILYLSALKEVSSHVVKPTWQAFCQEPVRNRGPQF